MEVDHWHRLQTIAILKGSHMRIHKSEDHVCLMQTVLVKWAMARSKAIKFYPASQCRTVKDRTSSVRIKFNKEMEM